MLSLSSVEVLFEESLSPIIEDTEKSDFSRRFTSAEFSTKSIFMALYLISFLDILWYLSSS